MMPTRITLPPAMSDYVSLGTYQSTTPASFTDGRPVMHLSSAGVHAFIPRSQCERLPIFEPRADGAALLGWTKEQEEAAGHGDGAATAHESLDVFITSKSFILFNMRLTTGVHVPYNLISIHGLKKVGDRQSVWMQLDLGNIDDDDYEPVEMTLMEPERRTAADDPDAEEAPSAAQIFQAIADCSDLNPDPTPADGDADERVVIEGSAGHEALEGFGGVVLRGAADGGLPPPLPGSGGWITADNLHEYFDEEGNWKGDGENGGAIEVGLEGEGSDEDGDEEEGEPLGEGAGRTRDRDELRKNGLDGDEEGEDPDNKRPRVG